MGQFSAMFCGPWYFIRNQVMGVGFYMLKYRMVDRFLLAHNTFVGWNTLNINDQNILYALSRNNLWIQAAARVHLGGNAVHGRKLVHPTGTMGAGLPHQCRLRWV